ncbi:MAG: nicotinate-nucleotide adenylyltransferase [Lachnospiraceae bacterium]|nr:nicotinate-nucleotide adenylyltransferase [Lachnospiraceae bacterium]
MTKDKGIDNKNEKRLGIMGGTFNPIHFGHLLMAQRALADYELDEICFIPTGIQWMKKGDPDLLDGDIRYEMTRLAIEDNPSFSISRMEIDREGNTYTYETMEALRKEYPDALLYYIVGADTLNKMDQWRSPEIVFQEAIILCAVRGDQDKAKVMDCANELIKKYEADIRFLDIPRMDISSTDIRNRVRESKSVRYLLPDQVMGYIADKRLYQA